MRYLDQMYANLDPDDGLFWPYAAAGLVDTLVDDERIASRQRQPPDDSRAWTRAMLLRVAPPGSVVSMDWDEIVFEHPIGSQRFHRIALADPLSFCRSESEPIFRRSQRFDELLEAFGAERLVPAQPANGWRGYGGGGARYSVPPYGGNGRGLE